MVVGGGVGGLVALGRWGSRLGGMVARESPADWPSPDAKELLPGHDSRATVWPPSAEEVAACLPFDPALGRLRITKFFFEKTDAVPGPADPEVFAALGLIGFTVAAPIYADGQVTGVAAADKTPQ